MNQSIAEISKEYKRTFLKRAIKGNLSFMLLLVIINMVADRNFVPQTIGAAFKIFLIYITIAVIITLIASFINRPYQLLCSLDIEADYLKQHLEYFLYKEKEHQGNWQLFANESSSFIIIFPNVRISRNENNLIIISSKRFLKKLQKRLEYRHKGLYQLAII